MQNPDTIDELVSRLDSRASVRTLAENMCNPLWRAEFAAMSDQLMMGIGQMKTLEDTLLPELQKALVDEFTDALDSPDAARRAEVARLMHELIPPEVNRKIMAAALGQTLDLSQDASLGLGLKPRF